MKYFLFRKFQNVQKEESVQEQGNFLNYFMKHGIVTNISLENSWFILSASDVTLRSLPGSASLSFLILSFYLFLCSNL